MKAGKKQTRSPMVHRLWTMTCKKVTDGYAILASEALHYLESADTPLPHCALRRDSGSGGAIHSLPPNPLPHAHEAAPIARAHRAAAKAVLSEIARQHAAG